MAKPRKYAREHQGRYQPLQAHIERTMRGAREKMSVLSDLDGCLAEFCAAVHDLGKTTDEWQRYLMAAQENNTDD